MAADPRVGERVYREIRRLLFAGTFRLRERLDVASLGEKLNASNTPVREALVRLAAERLIASKPPRGYFVSLWSEAELGALYDWRASLLRTAIEEASTISAALDASLDFPLRVAAVFQTIEAGANAELKRAAANADDRLYFARLAEAEVFDDTKEELETLAGELQASKKRAFAALRLYHARRTSAARLLRERAAVKALGPNGE